jgi:hypothetical protein
MTRGRWILIGVVGVLLAIEAGLTYMIFSHYDQANGLALMLVVIIPMIEVLWRYAHPYIPDREGLIWGTGWPTWTVDDIRQTVARAEPVIKGTAFGLMLVHVVIWGSAVYLLIGGRTVAGISLLIVACLVQAARFVLSVLLPRELQ